MDAMFLGGALALWLLVVGMARGCAALQTRAQPGAGAQGGLK